MAHTFKGRPVSELRKEQRKSDIGMAKSKAIFKKIAGPKRDSLGKKIRKASTGKYGSYLKERKELI